MSGNSDFRVLQVYETRAEAEAVAEILKSEHIGTRIGKSFEVYVHFMDVARSRKTLSFGCVILEQNPGKEFTRLPCPNCGERTVTADRSFFLQSLVIMLFAGVFARHYESPKRRWACSTCLVCWIFTPESSR